MSSPPPASALGHAGIIAIRGPATTELRLAVGAAGFSIEDESVASAIVCFEHSSSEIEALCRDHKLVIADANPGDMTRVAQLLRLGVAEVLPKPVMADKLVAQLRRAIRIHNRSTRG